MNNLPFVAPANPMLRIQEIEQELNALDLKRIRPTAESDASYLAMLNAKAIDMRDQIRMLRGER